MAITIDATVGGASANSYRTLADTLTYFEGRLNATGFTGATADNQNRALVQAARRMDQLPWVSQKAASTQALSWPRWDAVDEDGNSVSSDTIPVSIKDGQCELALYMLNKDLLADTGLEGFANVKVGPIDVTPRHVTKAGKLPENVYREIKHYLGTGRGQVRLRKA